MKICIPLRAKTQKELLKKIQTASKEAKEADVIELWLGDIPPSELNLEEIFQIKTKPYLLNVKGKKEMGKFIGTDQEKLQILLKGVELGAEYCDFDFEFPENLLKEFIQQKRKTQLILSAHFFDGTPSLPSILSRVRKMQDFGADIVKIAAKAKSFHDLITLLRLAENLQRQKQKFIAISMGNYGKISRIATPLMGGEMMFASWNEQENTAEGQMTAEEMRACLKYFQ